MVTIYELLEVPEDASKEEIERAYSRLILEFRQDIHFDQKTNEENAMIINKIKIAYEILMDDEKRKKYDLDLAQKRAENLIENVETVEEEPKVQEQQENMESTTYQKQEKVANPVLENNEKTVKNETGLSQEEKKQIQKAAKKEFQHNLKKVKEAEDAYNEAYNQAYNDYLRKMGFQVKEPWTLKRILRVVGTVFVIILCVIILWHIPYIRNILTNLYKENFIIKALVDLIKTIIDSIMSIF